MEAINQAWDYRTYREKGYITQAMPIPMTRNISSDHRMYLTRSRAVRRLKKANAMEIISANRSSAWKWLSRKLITLSFAAARRFVRVQRRYQVEHARGGQKSRAVVAFRARNVRTIGFQGTGHKIEYPRAEIRHVP